MCVLSGKLQKEKKGESKGERFGDTRMATCVCSPLSPHGGIWLFRIQRFIHLRPSTAEALLNHALFLSAYKTVDEETLLHSGEISKSEQKVAWVS